MLLSSFTIPGSFTDETPFEQMDVWRWALTQTRANVNISKYLDSINFVIGKDRLTESQYKRLEYAVDCFHRCAPRMPVAFFSDLFTEAGVTDSNRAFWVQGKPGRWVPGKCIVDCLQASGWIYEISPETTYFEIIGENRLFAKYQRILGSRFLCEVK